MNYVLTEMETEHLIFNLNCFFFPLCLASGKNIDNSYYEILGLLNLPLTKSIHSLSKLLYKLYLSVMLH